MTSGGAEGVPPGGYAATLAGATRHARVPAARELWLTGSIPLGRVKDLRQAT